MPDEKKIYSINSGKKATKESLIELANDPDVESFMIVALWSDGSCSTGWSSGITNGELAYGTAMLQRDMFRAIS